MSQLMIVTMLIFFALSLPVAVAIGLSSITGIAYAGVKMARRAVLRFLSRAIALFVAGYCACL